MKRRDFNKSLAAALAAPLMPVKALAAAPAAAAPASPGLYSWSVAIARTHGKCSAPMLARMLHIDAVSADCLFKSMIGNNVIGPANAVGLSVARSTIPSPTGTDMSLDAKLDTGAIKDKARKYLGLTDEDEAVPAEPIADKPDTIEGEEPLPDLQP